MAKKKGNDPKPRQSPVQTVKQLTDEFMSEFDIPQLPEQVPKRLSEALEKRVKTYLYILEESLKRRYIPTLEIRLVRDCLRAVLTVYELQLPDGEVHYARFRKILKELGYERTSVGFKIKDIE